MPPLPQLAPDHSTAPLHQLRSLDVGELRLGEHDRLLYSTDASLYQVLPLGVVIPESAGQIRRLLEFCNRQRVALLPRGGGTSLAGQCTAKALVMDLSPHFRRVWDVDVAQRRCKAEAGVVLDQLNRELLGDGLFFAPDPATSAQACLGGCIGNNAAGARSIRYGRTSENMAKIEVFLASGERLWLGPGAGAFDPVAARLAVEVARIVRSNAALIRQRFPRLIRRNAGYGLDLILDQLDAGIAERDLDLCGLLCGSEGTLAITLAAELKLQPLPKARGLAITSFDSIDAAIAAVPAILATGPSAVELLDSVVLRAAAANVECSRYLPLIPALGGKPPAAALYVEYQTEAGADELAGKFDELRRAIADAPLVIHRDPALAAGAWTLRKSAEALLHGMSATHKPVTFVEDNSVPVENLAQFVREFRRIVEAHGTNAAFYAHASVGVLHVRPMIDLRQPAGLEKMQSIAVQVADLARDCGGVMSGEHGDGKARGPLLERFYGSEIMAAFRQIKQLFDPGNLLNPGNIVDAGPVASITQSLRVQQEQPVQVETFFDYEDQEGFASAVETCNGAGFCRKMAGGTMCPSYRATLDERHSTRGRGNALRLAITGQLSADREPTWNDAETIATLNLCLSCKACKTECPSNVDVSRLKAEYTAQRFEIDGAPLAAKVFGHIRFFNRIGSAMPGVANWMLSRSIVRGLIARLLHVSAKRKLPALGPSLFTWFERDREAPDVHPGLPGAKVLLFGDCFTAYNEPHIGRSAVRVLEQLGYQVLLPDFGCCGRSMISVGLLDDAIHAADWIIGELAPLIDDPALAGIVVCEPSCLSAMKDDWLQLKLKAPMDLRRRIAGLAMLVEDFVEKKWDQHPARLRSDVKSGATPQTPVPRYSEEPDQPPENPALRSTSEPASGVMNAPPIVLHGHCHQKALWGDQTSSAILRRLSGGKVEVLPSGCCGMAGAFGYAADKYDLSMKIGELSVFPPIRAADAAAVIVAPGTSCRHQIRDGTGRDALHPIEVVEKMLEFPASQTAHAVKDK